MAQIDLKDAVVRILDGDSRAGAVNNVAGYAAGQSVILVDSFPALRSDGTAATTVVGRKVTFAGHDTEYEITAAVAPTQPTSITISPVLTDAVVDDEVVTVSPAMLEINTGEGTLTYDEKVDRQYMRNRGRLNLVRNGDEQPVDVKLDIIWEFITAVTGSGTPTPEDFLKKRGEASGLVTTADDECQPFSVDLQIVYTPNCGTEDVETIVLEEFRYETLNHDLKAGMLSVSGKCNRTEATVTRG